MKTYDKTKRIYLPDLFDAAAAVNKYLSYRGSKVSYYPTYDYRDPECPLVILEVSDVHYAIDGADTCSMDYRLVGSYGKIGAGRILSAVRKLAEIAASCAGSYDNIAEYLDSCNDGVKFVFKEAF